MPKKTSKRKKKVVRKKSGKAVKKKPVRKKIPKRKAKKKVVRKKTSKRPMKRKPVRKKTAKKKSIKKKVAGKKVAKMTRKPSVKSSKTLRGSKPLAASKPPVVAEERVGVVIHYFSHLNVAVVRLDHGELEVGDSIRIKGYTTDLHQTVESMEVEHQTIQRAGLGQEFGMKVVGHVREHDLVYRMIS